MPEELPPDADAPEIEQPDPSQPGVDIGKSIIRTLAPYATAYLVAYLKKNGLEFDDATVSASFVTIAGTVYYTVVRAVEQRFPKAGWLLGVPAKPHYSEKVA